MNKKAKVKFELGERLVDLQWDRHEKVLSFVSNPLKWILTNEDFFNNTSCQELYEKYNFDISVTMNGIHWMDAGYYNYYNVLANRIVYVNFPLNSSYEDRLNILKQEDHALTDDEKIGMGLIQNTIDDKKKKEEINKKIEEENNIVNSIAKRAYSGIYIYGDYFPCIKNKNNIKVRLRSEDGVYTDVENTYWKNKKKLGVLLPDIKLSHDKVHTLYIDVTFNNSNYTSTNLKILYQGKIYVIIQHSLYLCLLLIIIN